MYYTEVNNVCFSKIIHLHNTNYFPWNAKNTDRNCVNDLQTDMTYREKDDITKG